jgi:tetratricopeptide (TPR) repeat protein
MRQALTFAFLLWTSLAAVAQDQNAVDREVKLDTLFGNLRQSDSGVEILSSERMIWELWMQGGTEKQNADLQMAANAMGLGQYAVSEAILNQLIQDTQQFPEAYNKRATLYYLMGKYQASLDDISLVLNLEPRHFGALSGKGMVLQKMGRNGEALAAYKEAIAVHPHMVGARLAIQQLEALVPDL